jgi:hypothetical protein
MNKYLLRLKLEKLLPAEDVSAICDMIMSTTNVDNLDDIVIDKGQIKGISTLDIIYGGKANNE